MTRRSQHGFTLIELIIFIVVVSVGIAGILSVVNNTIRASADPMLRKQSIAIAESLLEEILSKEYANPVGGYTAGPIPNRALFDDVMDYVNYSTAGGIVDALGVASPGLAAYNIAPAVTVTDVVVSGVTLRRVVVSVTDPQAGVISLVGYRGNY